MKIKKKANYKKLLKHKPRGVQYFERENDLKPHKYNKSSPKFWVGRYAHHDKEEIFGKIAEFAGKSDEMIDLSIFRPGDIGELRVERWINKEIKRVLKLRFLVTNEDKSSLIIKYLKKGEHAEKVLKDFFKKIEQERLARQEKMQNEEAEVINLDDYMQKKAA